MGACCSLLCACCPDGGYSSIVGGTDEFDGIDMGMGTGYYQSSPLPVLDDTGATPSTDSAALLSPVRGAQGTRAYNDLLIGMSAGDGAESKTPSPAKKVSQPLAIAAAPAKSGLFVRYNILEVVGEGSTSKCHKAIRKADGAIFACKIIDRRNVTSKFNALLLDQLLVETQVLKLLRQHPVQHPHIVQLQDHYETNERTYLVMEMLSGGELLDHIASCGTLTEAEAAVIIGKIISVVSHLHSMHIIHRDLKPENFLIAESASQLAKTPLNGSVKGIKPGSASSSSSGVSGFRENDNSDSGPTLKLIDFGLSKLFVAEEAIDNVKATADTESSLDKNSNAKISAAVPIARTFLGTKGYMAPEIFQRRSYDSAVDMWSVGVIAYIILIGCMPFDADTDTTANTAGCLASCSASEIRQRFKLVFPVWAAGLSANAKDLLGRLIEVDASKRLTGEQALLHPWLQPNGASKDKYLQSPVLLGERARAAARTATTLAGDMQQKLAEAGARRDR